jgi:hypothetical protein
MTTTEKPIEIHHPVTGELVTVQMSGEGTLRTIRFACGSTALLPAAYVRGRIKLAKAARARQEGK